MSKPSSTSRDRAFMARALALADAQLGRVAPNPAVGCVIVREGRPVAEAATGDGGRPHAEEAALARAGKAAAGAEVYVSLEPCAARSSGAPSCADRLIAARPARVVTACVDPHPYAAGAGIARLRAAGIAVAEGVLAEEAAALNAGFFLVAREGRPLVALAADPARYDAVLSLDPGGDLRAGLSALAQAGFTRVCAAPGGALAAALAKAGLVDRVEG